MNGKWTNFDHALRRLPVDTIFRLTIIPDDKSQEFPNMEGQIFRSRLGVQYLDADPMATELPADPGTSSKKSTGTKKRSVK